jgi:List-Bact-rpt repeat protein
MSQRRSTIKSVLISFLLASLVCFSWYAEVFAAQLTLGWTDNSTSEDGFNIERRPGSSMTFAQIATVGPNVTTYTDGALPDATTYCYRVQAFNTAGSSGYSNEQCATTAAATTSFTLTVSKSGTGSGTVTGTGINCGADCTEILASGTSVALTAAAASGSTFAGWSGGGCTGTGTCTVTMSAATTVTASFNLSSGFALTVNVAVQATSGGSASGRVVSNPVGIDCGTDCTETYTSGRVVALTPLPEAGSVFAGWTGHSDCRDGSVTMNANKSCTANFALVQALLSVTTIGNGTVSSTSAGITCGSNCSFGLSLGSTVTLRATSTTGSAFAGWSGAGCQGTGSCTVKLTTNKSVTATFLGSGSTPTDKIGVYRPSAGQWLLDLNGNGVLESCSVDLCVSSFTSADAVPVVGQWDGSGVTQLGLFLTDTAEWHMDRNANETWEGCDVDRCIGSFGHGTDMPVSGKWNTKGFDRIGVFRPATGKWYLDVNGNGKLNSCDSDRCANLKLYQPGDLPVTGDWNGDGTTQVGLFRPGSGEWFLDYNGNRAWDGCRKDHCVISFGTAVDLPVSGDWNGSGTSKIGVFRPSTGEWFLDLNGNGQWDGCGVDLCVTNFGRTGDFPVVGKW